MGLKRFVIGEDETDIGLLIGIIPVGLALSLIGFAFLNQPTKPPPADALVGCFKAADAPSMLFKDATVQIGGTRGPKVAYHFELEKYGTLSIAPDKPFHIDAQEDGKASFAWGDSSALSFLRLAHTVEGKTYGVFKPEDAEYIEGTANDGTVFPFNRAPAEACR